MSISFDFNDLFYIESNLIGERVSLFDLAVWKNGLAFKNIDFSTTGKPVIKIAELNNGISNNTAYTDKEYSDDVSLTYGDLVFSWSGNPQTSIDIYKYILPDGWLNQHIFKVTPSSKVDKDFLFYVMKYLKPNFTKIATNKQTTGLGHVTLSDIKRISLILPTPYVQKQISAILSSIDNKIELNQQQNNNLEQQAQALFKSWFVDFEPFGGKMPDDWKVINLSDIATFVGGYSYKGSELQTSSTAMATIKNFDRQGGFKLDGFKEILPSLKLKETQKVDLFDILVAHTDLTQNADVIGNAEMLLSKAGYLDVIISMDVVKVLPQTGVSKFLLAALLKDNRFKQHSLGYINGTTVLHLSKKALPEYTFAFPNNVDTVDELTQTLEYLYKKLALNIEENTRLAQLRDTLLPKLMSGEIDVSKVNISADKLSFTEE